MGKKIVKTVCEIGSEFTPRGTQGVVRGTCKKLTGTDKVTTTSKNMTCTTTTDWFGRDTTECERNN